MALTDGLIEYWTFDSNGNGSLGNYNFTVYGATNTTCKINNGYVGDGNNDYLLMGSLNSSPSSFCIWYKPGVTITTSTNARILIHHNPATAYRYTYLGNASGSVANELVTINHTTSYNGLWYWNTTAMGVSTITNEWHLFVFVWESASSKYRLYYDNVDCGLAASYLSPGKLDNWVNTRLLRYVSTYYADSVDAMGIWSTELTSADAAQLWNNGDGLQYPFSSGVPLRNSLFFGSDF